MNLGRRSQPFPGLGLLLESQGEAVGEFLAKGSPQFSGIHSSAPLSLQEGR